jgi:VWFA-related protein
VTRRWRSPTRLVAALACLTAALPLAAQGPSYKTGISLVVVDMRVLRGGSQVTDLRADELTLLVDGKPRPIVSLTFESATDTTIATAGPSTASAQAAVAHAGRQPPRRLVFVIDRRSIAAGEARRVEEAAERFLEHLAGGYTLAVLGLPVSKPLQFHADSQAARRALADAFEGTLRQRLGMEATEVFGCDGPAPPPNCAQMAVLLPRTNMQRERAMNTAAELTRREDEILRDLHWLFIMLGAGNGPADVVLIHGGLPTLSRMRRQVDRAVAAAFAGRIRVHALEVANLTDAVPGASPSPEIDTAEFSVAPPSSARTNAYGLASQTGGLEQSHVVSGADLFTRLGMELTGSYLLGFEAQPTDGDGKAHRIEVRIGRKGFTVHARKAFILSPSMALANPRSNKTKVGLPTAGSPDAAAAAATLSSSAFGFATLPAPRTVSPDEQNAVMARASMYVDHFERILSSIVAEERYVQVLKRWTGSPPSVRDEPELAWRAGSGSALRPQTSTVLRRRQILADILLVQTAGTAWVGYRDVAEVDGKAVRDRSDRIKKLFLSARPDDAAQLERITDESARYNIGAGRNINTPNFPLQVVRALMRGRFEIAGYQDAIGDLTCCAVISFRETKRPTLVRSARGRDIPTTGDLWIEPATGRIHRATLRFEERREGVRGAFDVTFRTSPGLDVLVPERQWEWYLSRDPDDARKQAYVEGEAIYSNIRRFTVTTEDSIR